MSVHNITLGLNLIRSGLDVEFDRLDSQFIELNRLLGGPMPSLDRTNCINALEQMAAAETSLRMMADDVHKVRTTLAALVTRWYPA